MYTLLTIIIIFLFTRHIICDNDEINENFRGGRGGRGGHRGGWGGDPRRGGWGHGWRAPTVYNYPIYNPIIAAGPRAGTFSVINEPNTSNLLAAGWRAVNPNAIGRDACQFAANSHIDSWEDDYVYNIAGTPTGISDCFARKIAGQPAYIY